MPIFSWHVYVCSCILQDKLDLSHVNCPVHLRHLLELLQGLVMIRMSFCGCCLIYQRDPVSISCAGLNVVVLEAWICERAGVLGHISLMQLFSKPWDISTRFCSFCPPDPVTNARSPFSFAVLKRHFFISLFSSCTQTLSRVLTALDWSLRSSGLLYFLKLLYFKLTQSGALSPCLSLSLA